MSNLATTSRVQMRYILESTFGVTPVAGNPTNLRMTGESLDFNLSKVMNKEIRSDRQNSGATTVDASSGGDINFHFQYAEYDPLLAPLLMSAYTVYGTLGETATSFNAAYTATTITASVAPAGNDAFTLLQRGQWFQVNHAANANNLKILRVSTTVDPTSTVITLDANTVATVVTASAGAKIRTQRLTNGVAESSYTFEKQAADITQFITYRGQYVSKMNVKFASAALVEGAFSLMGKDAVSGAVTTLPGAPVASKTFEVQNAVRGVAQLWEGTTPLTNTFIKSLDLTVDNNLRNQTAIGNLGPVGIGVGDLAVTGSFSAYFANTTIYAKFLADTYTQLILGCQDASGNGYVITLPRVMLMTGKIVNGSENTDVMADFTFSAFADDTNAIAGLRKTIFIDRVGTPI